MLYDCVSTRSYQRLAECLRQYLSKNQLVINLDIYLYLYLVFQQSPLSAKDKPYKITIFRIIVIGNTFS